MIAGHLIATEEPTGQMSLKDFLKNNSLRVLV